MAGDDAKERLFKDLVVANQRRILPIARSYARADGKQATLLHYLEKQEPRPAQSAGQLFLEVTVKKLCTSCSTLVL